MTYAPENNKIKNNFISVETRGRKPGSPNKPKIEPADIADPETAAELQSFVDRAENIIEEKKARADDFKELIAELTGRGFDAKAFKTVLKIRSKDPSELSVEESMVDLYKQTLGMA